MEDGCSAEELLRQRDGMLRTIASCARRLLQAREWEQVIDDVLRELGTAAGASRAYAVRARGTDGRASANGAAAWCARGVAPWTGDVQLEDVLLAGWPGLGDVVLRGDIVHERTASLPQPTRTRLEAQGVRSILAVPLMDGDRCTGLLGLDDCANGRDWSTAEIEMARSAAELLGAAIARQRSEKARADAERRYRTLVESLPLTTYIDCVDETGSAVFVSPQIEGVLGYSVEEWLTDPDLFAKVVHPDDRSQMLDRPWPETDGPHRAEYRMIAKDGSVHWFLDEYTLIRDETGKPEYAQGYLIEIDERKAIEQELRQTNELLQGLVDSSPIATIVVDRNENVVFWNTAAEELYGYSRADVVGKPLPTRPPDREAEYELFREAAARGEQLTRYLTKRRRSDGTLIDVRLSSNPIRDGDGTLVGVLTIETDVTEERRAEAALRASEQHFRAVFDNAKDAIAILDDDRRYIEANPSYFELFRTTREQLIGKRIDGALNPGVLAEMEARWRRLHAQGEISEEVQYELVNGERLHVQLFARSNFLPGRHLLIMRNVTEQRSLESQLLRSQRLEAVGQLAGGIAHDFNNLLTAISGYSEFLLEGLGDDDPLRGDAAEIRRAADVAAALVRQLLAFSRRQMLQPRIVGLNGVVTQAESLLRRLIGEDILLSVALAPNLPPLRADPAQLEQIIVNLAINARDAMPLGGTLSIETALADDGRAVELVVRDDGIGMDDFTRTHAFDPFFTTKEPGKGTGLGLSTVYGIVAQTGGTIELESEPGRGTTFRITLPAIRGPEIEADVRYGAIASLPGQETVLLVEDEDIVRSLTERVLAAGGYRVLSAAHGEEALELVSSSGASIDVLLTDVVMPGMSGTELAERLRGDRPELRVLFTSGYANEIASELEGARTGFIPKPFTPEGLRQAVRTLLEGA